MSNSVDFYIPGSDAPQKTDWDDFVDSPAPEQSAESSAQEQARERGQLEEVLSPKLASATELAMEIESRTTQDVLNEMEEFASRCRIADVEDFLNTGQLQPGDSEEDAAKLVGMCDEYASIILDGEIDDVRELDQISEVLGGRYADRLPKDITLAQIDEFYQLAEDNGYKKLSTEPSGGSLWLEYSPDGLGSRDLTDVVRDTTFSKADIKQFYELGIPTDEEYAASPKSAAKRVRTAIVKTYSQAVERELASGKKTELSPTEAKVLASCLPAENMAKSEVLSRACVSSLRESIRIFREDPNIEYNEYTQGYFLSPTMRAAMHEMSTLEPGQEILPQEDVQALGAAILKRNSRWRLDGTPEKIIELSKLGFQPFDCDTRYFLGDTELQQQLFDTGAITPEKMDELYIACIENLRKTGRLEAMNLDIPLSGKNPVAEFWARNHADLRAIIHTAVYAPREDMDAPAIIDEDLHPTQEFLRGIIRNADNSQPDSAGGMHFILRNRELFRDQEALMYDKILLGSSYQSQSIGENPITPIQSVTVNKFLDLLTDKNATDAAVLRSFMLGRAWIGNQEEYAMDHVLPENIDSVVEVIHKINSVEKPQIKAVKTVIEWGILGQNSQDPVAEAATICELAEQQDFKAILDKYPVLSEKLFRDIIGNRIAIDTSSKQRCILAEYMKSWDPPANPQTLYRYDGPANRLFMNHILGKADDQSSEGGIQRCRYEILSEEEIMRIAEASRQTAERVAIPEDIHGCIFEWLAGNADADIAVELTRLEKFFEDNVHNESFSESFPHLGRSAFRDCFKVNLDRDLTPAESKILDNFLAMRSDQSRFADKKSDSFKDFMFAENANPDGTKSYRYEHLPEESIDAAPGVLDQLFDSNSLQLSRHAPDLAESILQLPPDAAREQATKLERIFLRRDIPDFAKLYCCASIRYEHSIKSDTDISPVLQETDDTRSVIMTDLLRSSIRSNNASLREYLSGIIAGKELAVQNHEAENTLTTDKKSALDDFMDGKKFRTRFFGYAYRLGFDNATQILEAMDRYREERSQMHIESVVELPDGTFRLREGPRVGDLVKGINSKLIHSVIRDGFNCPELLGENDGQDYTHWDVDFGSVSESKASEGKASKSKNPTDAAISGSLAHQYGDGIFAFMRDDDRFAHTFPGDTNNYSDFRRYEAYHGTFNGDNFRGIRSSFGSEDIDFYVAERPNDDSTLRMKYEIAKHGCYVPIVDRATEQVIFTPSDFKTMRAQMGGAEYYAVSPGDLHEYHFEEDLSLPDHLSPTGSPSFSELVAGFDEKERETSAMETAVIEKIRAGIERSDLPEEVKQIFRNYSKVVSRDAAPGTLDAISTGSTGRFTNAPHDADFDFIWRIDRTIKEQYGSQIMSALVPSGPGSDTAISRFSDEPGAGLHSENIRKGIIDITLDGRPVEVEIDISPVVKTDHVLYSSDQALTHRFEVMRAQDPEKYKRAIANIIVAKQVLKQHHVYKKLDGGFGGIGVENWVLQHGGSLRAAAQAFLDAAGASNPQDEPVEFSVFRGRYTVFDLGENHLANGYPFDNFIGGKMVRGEQKGGLSPEKYLEMIRACREILGQSTSTSSEE